MRFDIAKSLNGNNTVYIARDPSGIVRLRADSVEGIQEAIKAYNEKLAQESQLANSQAKMSEKNTDTQEKDTDSEPTLQEVDSPETQESKIADDTTPPIVTHSPDVILEATVPDNEESQKKYAHEVIEEKKKPTGKKSFWDKLK